MLQYLGFLIGAYFPCLLVCWFKKSQQYFEEETYIINFICKF